MKKLLITTLLVTTTMGATTYANTLQDTQDKPQEVETTATNTMTLEQVQERLEEVQTKLTNGEELNIEEYKETLSYLSEVLPSLVEENSPKIGDGVEEVSYFLQLEQARQDTEEFASWLDTLEVMQPMSNDELVEILGE